MSIEPVYYALAIVIIIIMIVVFTKKKPRRKKENLSSPESIANIVRALGEDNIYTLSFIRNKINATLIDNKKADFEALKRSGAEGINIVGATVKCYFPKDNEAIYKALEQALKHKTQK